MPMLVRSSALLVCNWPILIEIGVIQDAKFKRREALADLAKVAAKK